MRTISECRSCESTRLEGVLDLGEQYVSDFRDDTSKPNKYPLVAVICEDCMLVQLRHTTPSGEMYHENYGFKSGVSDSIKNDLKEIVAYAQTFKKPKSWLDIASNDGTLLSFVPKGIRRVGVDPIEKYCKEAKQHADQIVHGFFDSSYFMVTGRSTSYLKFDAITSISCFYDMDDPNKFVGDVAKVLADDGVWVIQQNYLLDSMRLNGVDNFCHEHLEYYTLLSLEPLLERHGLEVIDLTTNEVNGGSLRTAVAKKGAYPVKESVENQRQIELGADLHKTDTYQKFAGNVLKNLKKLRELINEINGKGQNVYILAASTRGATIWQTVGITEEDVPYAVERNPEKVGKYFSAVGMKIISEEQARRDQPDFMLVGPWFFADEIIKREQEYLKRGGKLIVPLPELRVVWS